MLNILRGSRKKVLILTLSGQGPILPPRILAGSPAKTRRASQLNLQTIPKYVYTLTSKEI